MKIVIDIPEELYKAYKGRPPMLGDEGMDMIAQSIANGTPLPKGHGRLIDADRIEWYGCNFEGSVACIDNNGNCDVCNHAECYAKQVRDLPTIIEADKGGEQE
ncbi:MAG: hypothetical protein IJP92_02705 [Lachnospiraceae bacterium]|nr:hypothetical protein [Lachnospiraceae bacterium]